MNTQGSIRNFHFPQSFISIPIYEKTLTFFNRRLTDFSSGSISALPRLEDTETERVRVKIQQVKYIKDGSNSLEGVLSGIRKNASLKLCRLTTLIRLLMLENLDEISEEIVNLDHCLAASHKTWFMINIKEKKIRQLDQTCIAIDDDTSIIMESDPI